MSDFSEITYVVDSRDHIVSVGAQWVDFAMQNQGPDLAPEDVTGRPLWDFIRDETTRTLYREVLAKVRAGAPKWLVLRCDAPGQRRLIEMVITPLQGGTIEFKTVLLSAKPRPEQRLLARSTPRTEKRVNVCCWCDRVEVGTDQHRAWVEVETAMEVLHLSDKPELPMIEPVTCPRCFAKVHAMLGIPT